MTLLSIREQGGFPDHFPCSTHGKCETCERDRRVILATRDAIARQVREKNAAHIKEMGGHHNRAVAMTHENLATFIEGLPL